MYNRRLGNLRVVWTELNENEMDVGPFSTLLARRDAAPQSK